jgi:hypothetical protein
MEGTRLIRPQPGYQTKVLSSPADIIISGAAAGVGKTYTLLLDPLRDVKNKDFGGVIFRRTTPQIRNEGGLWDTSMTIYPGAGALPKESSLEWIFPSGSKIKFSHLEYEKNIFDWQGAQIPFIGFDELTHFTKKMFFYLLSRNRSLSGVNPYCRATCNPDPESWVYELIQWWIDPETGFPISERDGVIRYMLIDGENYIWGDSYEEVVKKGWYLIEKAVKKSGIDPKHFVKTVTFISGTIYDNKELLSINPSYLGNLMAQDEETIAQLLDGNWKAIISDKDIYDYYAFIGLFENKYQVSSEGNYITADIALKGSNKFTVGHWTGMELDDLLIMDISKGNEVIDGINNMARVHKTPNRNIVFDNDGVGQFVDGFIVGAQEFNNGSSPLPDPKNLKIDPKTKKPLPENYEHLKAQCYYRSGDKTNRGEMRISERVANMMYDSKMTVRQRFIYERKAIKRAKADMDGKLRIIKKDEMKTKLNNESPDLMDMFMEREFFELVPKKVFADASY